MGSYPLRNLRGICLIKFCCKWPKITNKGIETYEQRWDWFLFCYINRSDKKAGFFIKNIFAINILIADMQKAPKKEKCEPLFASGWLGMLRYS